jgi:hypothetical protein
MFYSKNTGGFYSKYIHGKEIPSDAVKITSELYLDIIQGQALGKEISSDENGMPILIDAIESNFISRQVTRAQGKSALIRAGLWQGVIDYVNSISDPVEKSVAEVALHDTTHWQRSSPFLNAAAHYLGLTDAQLDNLFAQASQIEL